jgi:hypothetical protein
LLPTTVAGSEEPEPLEALPNVLLILHAVFCMSSSLFWWPLLKCPFMVRCFAAIKRPLMHPAAQQTSPKVGSVKISLKPGSIYVDGQGFGLPKQAQPKREGKFILLCRPSMNPPRNGNRFTVLKPNSLTPPEDLVSILCIYKLKCWCLVLSGDIFLYNNPLMCH